MPQPRLMDIDPRVEALAECSNSSQLRARHRTTGESVVVEDPIAPLAAGAY